MNRIAQALSTAQGEKRAALIAYLCCGDPSIEKSISYALTIAKAGADIIELGVPFSDPTADGPIIQQASQRALKSGTTLAKVFQAAKHIREQSAVPLVLFGYYNPILAFGEDAFIEAARKAGIDGVLIVDLPLDEPSLQQKLQAQGIEWIPLLAPTSSHERIRTAGAMTNAFVYYVSLTGVTGAKTLDPAKVKDDVSQLKTLINNKIAIGFGIKTPDDVRSLSNSAEALVVGSAIVDCIACSKNPEKVLSELVQSLREATSFT